jgi:hypothetical protein
MVDEAEAPGGCEADSQDNMPDSTGGTAEYRPGRVLVRQGYSEQGQNVGSVARGLEDLVGYIDAR